MNLCCLCFSDSTVYGEFFRGHDLILHDEHYKIVDGHDELIRYPGRPLLDPVDGMTEEQETAAYNDPEFDKRVVEYMEYAEKFRTEYLRFHPQTGALIVELAKEVGYDQDKHGWLEYWLTHRAAQMIRHYQNTRED
jgi:hypothetical protein